MTFHDLLMGAAIIVLVLPWALVFAAEYFIRYGPNPPLDHKHRD